MSRRDFAHVRVGHAGAHHALHKRNSCATGGFYTNPTTGMVISSANPLNITWDTACLTSTSAVDIYLIAPGLTNSRIHEWQSVNYGLGSYQATLAPSWWNDASSVQLQLSIVTSGSQPFLSPFPAGPVFTATYTAPTSGSTPANANPSNPNTVTYVNNFPTNSSLSKGKIAAGVFIPLLFIALGVFAHIRVSRAKGKEKRKRFSEAVDKRMSTISSDWKSITAAGATAAIRNSIAVGSTGNRSSAFTFGAIRPTSTMAVEGDSASAEKQSIDISQLRPGIRASAFSERVSRVSFAADVRPSMESRRTTATSRAFRSSRASSFIPPLPIPTLPTRSDTSDGDMSPTQTTGALSLTPEDIRAHMEGNNAEEANTNMDEVWPSLSMMRTGNEEEVGDDYLLPQRQSIDLPMPPFPAHAAPAPTSPTSGMMTMPDNVMSPDEMLRAYATRKMTSPPTSPIAFPSRTLSYNGSIMRSLYAPTTPTPDSSSAAVRVSVTQTPDAEKRYTTSYASIDPYGGFVP